MPSSSRWFDDWAVRLYQPVPPIRSRGDVGIAPYANGKILPFIGGPALTFRGPLHTRRCGGTLSKQERAGVFPTPVRASPCHRLPGEGFSPHPARAQPGPPSPEGKAASGGGGRYPRSGSPAALRQRTRREPSFTAIRALFSVKWLLTPRGKPGVNTPSYSS